MDIDVFNDEDSGPGLAAEVGKTFLLSAVAALGSFAGILAFGYVAGWAQSRREKKEQQGSEEETETE